MAQQAEDIEPGLYFGLPDDVYHAIPALSASGIKNLLVSPMDFWARCRWLNPLYEEEVDSEAQKVGTDEAKKVGTDEAKKVGTAYHKRILEGKDAFDARYAAEFVAPSDCLKTIDDIKEALAARGIKATGKLRKDFVALARDLLPDLLIYDDEAAKYERPHQGKIFLPQKLIDKIEIAAAMIEKHPHLGRCFTGGYPEVSVIWMEDGIKMKARFDYLKPRAIIDLKTFANKMNKPIDRAIYHAMASGKYHLQAVFYLQAVERAKDFCRRAAAGERTVIFPEAWNFAEYKAFCDELAACDEHGFYFVFQQKGIAPLARGKKFTRGMMHGAAAAAIYDAVKLYRECVAKFGSDPWIDAEPIESFEDDQFPVWASEI